MADGTGRLARQETWPEPGRFYRGVSIFIGNYARDVPRNTPAFAVQESFELMKAAVVAYLSRDFGFKFSKGPKIF